MSVIEKPEMACRELVELITDYLEGTLPRKTVPASSATWPDVTVARPTSTRCA